VRHGLWVSIAIASLGLVSRAQFAIAQTLQPTQRLSVLGETTAPNATSDKSLMAALTKPTGPEGVSIADFMGKNAIDTPEAKRDIPEVFADLVRYLRGDPSAVVNELKSLGDRYYMVVSAAQNDNVVAQNTLLAALALDRPSGDKLIDSLRVLDGATADKVASDIAEAQRLLASYTGDQIIASLLAQGAVRNGLSGSNDGATAGTGSIGLSLAKRDWQLAGLVTVASSIDTLRSGFGSFLLTPASGKGSLSTFLVDLHTPPVPSIWRKGRVSPLWPSLHVYFEGANSIWERATFSQNPTDPAVIDTTRSHKQAAVLGLGALLNWRIVRGRLLKRTSADQRRDRVQPPLSTRRHLRRHRLHPWYAGLT